MNEKFIEILKNNAISGVEIKPESDLFNDLGISSLGMFSVVCEIEREFNVKFNVMELVDVKTVLDLYNKFNF